MFKVVACTRFGGSTTAAFLHTIQNLSPSPPKVLPVSSSCAELAIMGRPICVLGFQGPTGPVDTQNAAAHAELLDSKHSSVGYLVAVDSGESTRLYVRHVSFVLFEVGCLRGHGSLLCRLP